jgi:hypothetical protein
MSLNKTTAGIVPDKIQEQERREKTPASYGVIS